MFDIKGKINEYLKDCITEVLKKVFDGISKMLFEPKAMPDFFNTVYSIFLGMAVMVMTCIILFKVIQYMIDVSNGERPVTIGELITRTIKSSLAIVIMPVLLKLVVGEIVYPLGSFIFSGVASDLGTATANYITGGEIGIEASGFVFIIMLGFITIAVACFLFKMCIYHADLIILQLMSVWAAISICADNNNYMDIWWREFISQITTILVQTLLISGVTTILVSEASWYNFMLLIGFCGLLIKGPSVLRSMWYSTGTGKGAMSGGKLAARLFLMGKG